MAGVFQKLNLKEQAQILVVNAPESFEGELAGLEGVSVVSSLPEAKTVDFSLAFVTTEKEVGSLAPSIAKKATGDALVWFAYPKKSSKRYRSEITRDKSWSRLGKLGFEAVRQVAIDEDWSALRFRRVEHIKTMKRDSSRAMTRQGKSRTK